MALASRIKDVTFEAADAKSLDEVCSFFVEAFWLGSTTFDKIELTASDMRQLKQKVAQDLGPRYAIDTKDQRPLMSCGIKGFPNKPLFETKLILAREPGGKIVGCAGIEAAFYDPGRGDLYRSAQSDRIVRNELEAMEYEQLDEAAKVYAEKGVGGLAKGIIQNQFTGTLVNPRMKAYSPCSVLANVAVAPSFRRTGLGRALCDECCKCTTDDWQIGEIALQVEECNVPARTLYKQDGYKLVFRTEEAIAIRLQPSPPSAFDKLPGPFGALAPPNEKLLKEVASPTLTMAKDLTTGLPSLSDWFTSVQAAVMDLTESAQSKPDDKPRQARI
jgi:ribosomal protein S18 acetylase RimI-like enzyme